MTQVKVDGPAKLISAALILVKQGVKRAVVTFGARGLAYADEARSLYQPARPVNLVDATGAGDALAATLIEALLRDEPIGVMPSTRPRRGRSHLRVGRYRRVDPVYGRHPAANETIHEFTRITTNHFIGEV